MNTESTCCIDMVKEVREKLILHWNYRGFTNLPEVIREYGSHIQEVYLKWNQLNNLPLWISELSNITNLYLHGNQIESLPDEIGEMTHLTTLDLGHNKLETLPRGIARLQNLNILLLNQNSIRTLPPEISQLTKLEILCVSGNKLIALPQWLGSLPNLEELTADCNCLVELPNRLTLAPRLTTLSVCSNRLQYLPLNGFLSSSVIQFDSNPSLNYISTPVRYQLIQKNIRIFRGIVDIPAYSCSIETRNEKERKLSICLEVKTSTQETSVVVLPRQFLQVHNISENNTTSLWELALRKVYRNSFEHTLEISFDTFDVKVNRTRHNLYDNGHEVPGHMYALLKNGPASICLGHRCRQPIFTEAWIVIDAIAPENPFLQLSVFCSKKCATNFTESVGSSTNLPWSIV